MNNAIPKGAVMKRFIFAALIAAFASGVQAEPESHKWFGEGLDWYQHPCGWDAFVKYGGQDTPQVRHNYYLTIQHPELCSKLFP
jgi:hypothetical protein